MHASEPEAAIGMWAGPNPNLIEMLETVGRDNNSVIVKFDINGSDPIIYRWNMDAVWIDTIPHSPDTIEIKNLEEGCWMKVNNNEPQKVL